MIIVKGKHAVLEALKGTNFVQEVIVLTQARSKEINHVVTVAKQKQVKVSYCDKKVAQKRYQVDGYRIYRLWICLVSSQKHIRLLWF